MVKAPERFLDEYLSHNREFKAKAIKRPPKPKISIYSDKDVERLKHNLQLLWDIYQTPEIQEILARKQAIRFLKGEWNNICICLSFTGEGILMEYELDMGSRKELAGARLYKQDERSINRYFTSEKWAEGLFETKDKVLQALVNVLLDKELSEAEIWDTIARGEQIHISPASFFSMV